MGSLATMRRPTLNQAKKHYQHMNLPVHRSRAACAGLLALLALLVLQVLVPVLLMLLLVLLVLLLQ